MKGELYQVEDCDAFATAEVRDLYRRYVSAKQVDLIGSFGFGRDLAAHAEGAWITTRSGRRILDFTGGIGVLNHGHNHPRILAARADFARKHGMEVHKNFLSPYVAALSHNIAQLMPGDLNVSYFPNSGAEAVEGALKMAYKVHGGRRDFVLHADISFHGKLFAAASITGSPEQTFDFPALPNVERFAFDSLDSVREQITRLRKPDGESNVYALIIEPFSGSSLRACSEEFLLGLRDICSREGVVLIFDEIYTGWAKCGELFYFMKYDVVPDILTMAKSLGGGKASIAGYVARDAVFESAYGTLEDATLHSTTFYGFGEETVTAIEAINIIVEENYVGRSRRIHDRLQSGLRRIAEQHPKLIQEVRGAGALNGLLLRGDSPLLSAVAKLVPARFFRDERFANKLVTAAVISDLYDSHGILTFFGSNREIPLIVSPPLVVSDEEIDIFLKGLERTLSKNLLRLVVDFARSKYLSSDRA